MEILTHNLPASARVLDLGAGGGSFSYRSTPAGVIAIDLAFPDQAQDCFARVVADAGCLPLRDHSIDVVICNNTLEHFDRAHDTVLEIDRVLGSGGHLWVSVPNGFSFDDGLYRFVFKGGGHVNRFTLSSLLRTIESGTHLSAQSYKMLYSGFVYLSPPPAEKLVHFPRRARVLSYFPPRLLELVLRWVKLRRTCLGSLFGYRDQPLWVGSCLSSPKGNVPRSDGRDLRSGRDSCGP